MVDKVGVGREGGSGGRSKLRSCFRKEMLSLNTDSLCSS